MKKPYRKGAALSLSYNKMHETNSPKAKKSKNPAARRAAAAKMLQKMTKMSTVKSEPDQQVTEGNEGGY